MDKGLWFIPLAAGIEDGVNPCVLMTSALVLLILLWLQERRLGKGWFFLLVGSLAVSAFFLNCGFDTLAWNKNVQTAMRWIYVVLAIAVGIQGLKFLREWFSLVKAKSISADRPRQLELRPLVLGLYIVGIGCLLSLLATLWTPNYYITIFSVYMKMPGQLMAMGSLMALYTVVSLWLVYVTASVVSLNLTNVRLFKIVAAAILLCASFGIIGLFYN